MKAGGFLRFCPAWSLIQSEKQVAECPFQLLELAMPEEINPSGIP